MFFDKLGQVSRLQNSGTDKKTYQPVASLQGFPIQVQPASAEDVALSEGVFGRTYTIFTTQSGINTGDRLTVSGTFIDNYSQNVILTVNGIEDWYHGPLPHFEIVASENKA